jgi:ribosomal protein S30
MIEPKIGHMSPTSTHIISAKNANNATPEFKKKQRYERRITARKICGAAAQK